MHWKPNYIKLNSINHVNKDFKAIKRGSPLYHSLLFPPLMSFVVESTLIKEVLLEGT